MKILSIIKKIIKIIGILIPFIQTTTKIVKAKKEDIKKIIKEK